MISLISSIIWKFLFRIFRKILLEFFIPLLNHCYGIHAINLILCYFQGYYTKNILCRFKARIGNGSYFVSKIIVDNTNKDYANLQIGEHCCIGTNTFFDLVEPILIEDKVAISAEVMFLTHADPGERLLRPYFPRKTGAIRIGKGSWIGARAIILPGVTIGECSVIGAGGVVTKDIPPFSVALGIPAKVVRTLKDSNLTKSDGDNCKA